MSGIRLGVGESARAFKGIICDDISEFESFMPSHAVSSLTHFPPRSPAGRPNAGPGPFESAGPSGARQK
jgi:hypothetical protein